MRGRTRTGVCSHRPASHGCTAGSRIGRSGITRRGPIAVRRTRFLRGRQERSMMARLDLRPLGWRPARSAERPRRRDHRAGDPGAGGSFRICPPRRERTIGPESYPARIESRTHRGHRSPRPNRARGPTNCPMRPGRERQRLPAPTSAPAYSARSACLHRPRFALPHRARRVHARQARLKSPPLHETSRPLRCRQHQAENVLVRDHPAAALSAVLGDPHPQWLPPGSTTTLPAWSVADPLLSSNRHSTWVVRGVLFDS